VLIRESRGAFTAVDCVLIRYILDQHLRPYGPSARHCIEVGIYAAAVEETGAADMNWVYVALAHRASGDAQPATTKRAGL
jgi:hypothetical protein